MHAWAHGPIPRTLIEAPESSNVIVRVVVAEHATLRSSLGAGEEAWSSAVLMRLQVLTLYGSRFGHFDWTVLAQLNA